MLFRGTASPINARSETEERGKRVMRNTKTVIASDEITSEGVTRRLPAGRYMVSVFGEVTSTNTLLKEQAAAGAPEGTVLIASAQSAGRGRMGRSFFSPEDTGLYMSLLLRPAGLSDVQLVTTAAAVAVSEAVEEETGILTGIKWVNDLYADGKKVCGILTEGTFCGGTLNWCVLGIGINVYPPKAGFPSALTEKAGALLTERIPGLRERLAAAILLRFSAYYDLLSEKPHLGAYRSRCFLMNRSVDVLLPEGGRRAVVAGIDDDFGLSVRYDDGSCAVLRSGEVSLDIKQTVPSEEERPVPGE